MGDGVMLPPSQLSSESPNLVQLAPTNEGFNALPAGTVDNLLKPENKAQLADILTYHVLPEQVLSRDLKFFQRVTTVEGKPLHVIKAYNTVLVGPSTKDLKKVVAADNVASNGVAHVIDGVMLPPSQLSSEADNFATNGVAHAFESSMIMV